MIEYESDESKEIQEAARKLAEGKLGLWNLFSPGLIVDGTNPSAVKRLIRVKGLDKKPLNRAFVSTLPTRELHRLIDLDSHHPNIRKIIENPNKLASVSQFCFYRFIAKRTLEVPLVQADKESKDLKKTIVILVHNYERIVTLYQKALEHKRKKNNPESNFLILGSSANTSGHPQPLSLEEVEKEILEHVDFVVDIPPAGLTERGMIPIIDLSGENPTELRKGIFDTSSIIERLKKIIEE